MDALLLSLMLCLVVGSAGKTPIVVAALYRRYGNSSALAAGVALGLGTSTAVAAIAGAFIAERLTPEARSLFFALSLASAALGLLFGATRIDRLNGWRLGPFFTGAIGLFILGFGGESAPFLIAGVAALRADPWMAGTGGWFGGMIACLLLPRIVNMDEGMMRKKFSRISVALILMALAFAAAMSALRLL
jgi:Ca2+/H+ antiporter, TMEM165/GDT1 family